MTLEPCSKRSKSLKDTLVSLTRRELDLAERIARSRTSESRKQNVKCQKRDSKRSGFEIDLEGACGEIVFAKLFKLDKGDITFGERKREDFAVNGKTIDVKASRHINGQLAVPKSKKLPHNICDYYCLVTGAGSEWFFRGFASKRKLFQDKNYRNLVKTDRRSPMMYCLTQAELQATIPLFSEN